MPLRVGIAMASRTSHKRQRMMLQGERNEGYIVVGSEGTKRRNLLFVPTSQTVTGTTLQIETGIPLEHV